MASAIFVLRILCAALLFAISDSLQKTVFTKFTKGVKWNEAREVCLSLGSDLAMIDRYATEYLLQAFAASPTYNTDNVWIGLHDVGLQLDTPGSQGYQWTSCDALDPGGWSNWQTGEPLNRWNNWCIRLQFQNDLNWYAEQCASMAHFLCQKTDGPCTDFKSPQTDGCVVSSEWLTKATKNTTSATSDSACRGDCQSYGQEDGSPLCWAYEFDGNRCGLYVTSSPVMCQSSGGAASGSNLMVRDCYSITYETALSFTPKNSHTEPQVNCSAVTTTSVQETTAPTTIATLTTTENTTPAQPTSASSSMTSSSTVTSQETQTTAQMTEKVTSSAPSLETTSVATTATTPTIQSTSTPATENTTPDQPTTTSSSVTSSSSVTTPGLHFTTFTTTEEVTSATESQEADTSSPSQYQTSTTTTNHCACSCRQPITVNVSASMATELANRLQEELRVNKSTLSSTRRRKESAADYRPSAQATGGIGIAVLVLVACLIVLPDLRNLAHTLCVSRSVCSRDQQQQFEETTAQEMEYLDSKA